MTFVLLVVLEGLILLSLCLDLANDFRFLPLWARAALTILAAVAILVPAVRRAPPAPAARRVREAFFAFAAGVILLGVLGLLFEWTAGRTMAQWDAGTRDRLEQRARILQEEFSRFLSDLVRPMAGLDLENRGREAAFSTAQQARRRSRLPADRYGVALYDAGGELLGWGGNSTSPPPDLLRADAPGPTFRMAGGDLTPRLYATGAAGEDEFRWVVEFLLKPPAAAGSDGVGPRSLLDFLPRWEEVAPASIQVRRDPLEGEDLAEFFDRQGDRHWGRQGRHGQLTLAFPLRTEGGNPLAVATLRDERAVVRVAMLRSVARRSGALLVVTALLVCLLLLLSLRSGLSGARLLVVGSAGVWLIRAALLLVGGAADLPRLSLYDISTFSSSALGGLMRSPADLLLSALACLAQGWLIRHYLIGLPLPAAPGARRRLSLAIIPVFLLLAGGGGLVMHALLDRMVLDTRLDISRVDFDARLLPRLALQSSLFVLVAAVAVVLIALFDLALRCRGRENAWILVRWFRSRSGDRLPFALRAAAGVVLLTLIYAPFLQHAYEHLRRSFFENDLVPRVLYQAPRRMEILNDVLLSATDPEFAAAASFAVDEEGGDSGTVAYRLWSATPMAQMGLASSLRIFAEEGWLLSRFAVNFAPMLEVPFSSAWAAAGGGPARLDPRADQTVRKAVVYGARWVRAPGRPPLLVVVSIIDDYDNVPMLGAETTFLPLLRARTVTRTNPELVRYDPMLAVFGPGLERLYGSGGEIPPPAPATIQALDRQPVVWTTDGVGEGLARIAYFRGADEIFALAHAQPGLVGRLAEFLRLVLLNGLVALALFALLGAGFWVTRRRRPRLTLGTTFYGRLTAVFLLTALVPLLALAYFVVRFSGREMNRELTSSGLGSLQVARRLIEDYLTVSGQDEAASLDDDVVFWLGRVVRQDINVFRESGLLATSSRELYVSALLNTRLDGEVYRALTVEREPFWQAEARLGEFEYLTLNAPMRIDRRGTIGIMSIPLASQRRAVARKIEQVEDAVLISTFLTVILLAAVGWLVARRISGPIAELARAARRVAEGDLGVRVEAAAPHEIGSLISSFNWMAGSLRDQREDLRRRRDYIEKILASATTGVLSLDSGGTLITINPAAQNLLAGTAGRPEPGEKLLERLGRDASLLPLHAALSRALGGGADDREIELALSRGDAELRLRAVFLRFAAEEGAPPGRIVLLEDITDIIRSGRLAAWAEMARRIAHEVKNPLTPIQLSVDHIRRVWRAGDERFGAVLTECLENIRRQVGALRRIASEFSDYSRLPELQMEPTAVEAIIAETLDAYTAASPPGVVVRREVASDLPLLVVDRAVIVRALVNLVENALQAMPEGGTLSIGATLADGAAGGARIRIVVCDTGVGIESVVRARLFEPYFSTKSGGTGLGLAIARKAVEEHGGTIEIRSRAGEGTVVTLLLPVMGRPDTKATA